MTLDLRPDFDLDQVAKALGMSPRWVRDRVKDGAEHQRYGRKIRFTSEQVEKLRSAHTKVPVAQSVTTGRKKKTS
jgi:DNA-binding Lrp family transcriptional regulator